MLDEYTPEEQAIVNEYPVIIFHHLLYHTKNVSRGQFLALALPSLEYKRQIKTINKIEKMFENCSQDITNFITAYNLALYAFGINYGLDINEIRSLLVSKEEINPFGKFIPCNAESIYKQLSRWRYMNKQETGFLFDIDTSIKQVRKKR